MPPALRQRSTSKKMTTNDVVAIVCVALVGGLLGGAGVAYAASARTTITGISEQRCTLEDMPEPIATATVTAFPVSISPSPTMIVEVSPSPSPTVEPSPSLSPEPTVEPVPTVEPSPSVEPVVSESPSVSAVDPTE